MVIIEISFLLTCGGNPTTWKVVNDTGHMPTQGAQIQSVSTNGITVTWNYLGPGEWRVASAVTGNHQNNNNGSYEPLFGGVGKNNCLVQLRHKETVQGKATWDGSAWVLSGDLKSMSYIGDPLNVFYFAHTYKKMSPVGGVYPLPVFHNIRGPYLIESTDQTIAPFGAPGYLPNATGFYAHVVDRGGNVAPTGAPKVISFQRTCDTILTDHTIAPMGATVFAKITMQQP